MATVLGPTAINERKFTTWSSKGRSLGLDWDTNVGTVTIPPEKITTAQQRIAEVIEQGAVTKTTLLSLLGSLRHIVSYCQPARSFFQRLQDMTTNIDRYGSRQRFAPAGDDLNWFQIILPHSTRFNQIPVDQFAGIAPTAVNVHMDASNQGLCVIFDYNIRKTNKKPSQQITQQILSTYRNFTAQCWPFFCGDRYEITTHRSLQSTYAFGLIMRAQCPGLNDVPVGNRSRSCTTVFYR
ncbi:hypothetical protein PHMEG_00028305 [Phytophthora megakarya]|uniref:Reverse transcriptase n=1 Tax=Phytophthora megakarya TaxID=4795 RepID=A0A225V4U1_9STRA|nr:hypothetical protein PHMEG_00028305 [Phytophthora megakarya]